MLSEFIPDLETRKSHTKYLTTSLSNFLDYFTTNSETKAYIVIFIHSLLILPASGYILFGKINKIYYAFIVELLIIFLLHFYFNGCILIRIEREFFNDKDWFGQWTIPFLILKKMGMELTPRFINNLFICYAILLSLFVSLRLAFNFD